MLIKGLAAIALLILLSLVVPLGDLVQLLDPENTERWLQEAGGMAPLFFVLLMTTAVVLSPIPSLPLTLAAGAFFGPFQGGLYSILGGVLGASLAFLLARFLGRQFLERILTGHINLIPELLRSMLGQALDPYCLAIPTSALRLIRHCQLWCGPDRYVFASLRPRHRTRDDPSDFCLHLFWVHTKRRPGFDPSNGRDLGSSFLFATRMDRKVRLSRFETPLPAYHGRKRQSRSECITGNSLSSSAISVPARVSRKGEKHHEAD